MIILDTNVLSELIKPRPNPQVVQWLNGLRNRDAFVTSISCAEMFSGVLSLPRGRRREALHAGVERLFNELFQGRSLPFDDGAARSYAEIVNLRQQSGRPISREDAQIAAIGVHHGMSIATRNTRDFEEIEELKVINPWL